MCGFGVDVLDPAVSLRRVWVLANRLPPWARAGGEDWSGETHMLALVADHLAHLTYVTRALAGDRTAKKPRPLPRPRPGGERPPEAVPAAPNGHGFAGQLAAQLAGIEGVRVRDGQ